MPFDVNKDGDVNVNDVGAKAGEMLTKKFDWNESGDIQLEELVVELGVDYAVKEVA